VRTIACIEGAGVMEKILFLPDSRSRIDQLSRPPLPVADAASPGAVWRRPGAATAWTWSQPAPRPAKMCS